jgi:2'-5' RNA ligase
MAFAVVLYFEDLHESEFQKIWKTLAEEGLSTDLLKAEIRPHITLGIFDELNCQPCDSQLAELAAQTRSLEFQITHLGLFIHPEPVVFAAPTITAELIVFHQTLHKIMAVESKAPWEMYLPGKWVPHCTLALGFEMEQVGKIFKVCQELKLPMPIKADQIGVVDFQPVKEVLRFDLI